MLEEGMEGFSCPQCGLPLGVDHFAVGQCECPERFPNPQLPSPTSCLPEEEAEELEVNIAIVNRFLLDLALSSKQEEQGKKDAFEGLVGKQVKIQIEGLGVEILTQTTSKDSKESKSVADSMGKKKKIIPRRKAKKKIAKKPKKKSNKKRKNKMKPHIVNASRCTVKGKVQKLPAPPKPPLKRKEFLEGRVILSGRNFVLLKKEKYEYMIPFERVCSISSRHHMIDELPEPELLDIDPFLRRCLTFRFGETVASSPELIQLFFGLRLHIYLLLLLDHKIKIRLEDEQLVGILKDVDEETISICLNDHIVRSINLGSVVYIRNEKTPPTN